MLGLHFITKNLISLEHGKTFSRLFELRHSGDYDDFAYCDKAMVDDFIPKAEAFIDEIRRVIGTEALL